MLKCNWPRWIFPWAIIPLALGAGALIFNTDSLEKQLTAEADARLKSAGAEWAAVSLDGRDATISGEAPSQEAASAAAGVVKDTYGIRRVTAQGVTIAAPVVLDAPTVDTVSGLSGMPSITGTWPEGKATTLAVTVAGASYVLGQNAELSSDGAGRWTLVPSAALTPGVYNVDVMITDSNKAEAAATVAAAVTVEEPSAPAEPTIEAVSASTARPTVTGTWPQEKGSSLTIGLAGKDYALGADAELTSDGAGKWSLTPSQALDDGAYDVTATVTNAAGKVSSVTREAALTVDVTPPQAPTVNMVTSRSVRPSINGTWPEGEATGLTVGIAGMTYTLGKDEALTSDGNGNWTLKLPDDLSDGTFDVTVTATDAAGNSSTDGGTGEVVVDVSAPPVPTVNNQLTRLRTPVVTGSWPADEADSLTVAIADTTYKADTGDGLTTDGNNWTLRTSKSLADGTYNVTATAFDKVGNAATDESSGELVVDATPPAVPTVNAYRSEFPRPLLSGTFVEDDSESLAVTFAGETFAKGSSDLLSTDGKGTWSVLTQKDYEPGTYDVKVVVSDKAGNQRSDTTTGEVVIVAPPAPAEPAAPAVAAAPAVDCQALFNGVLADGRDFEFPTGRATMLASSEDLLNQLATVVEQCPDARIEIGGHTDSRGSTSYNQALSERRAIAVRDALVRRGAKAENLSAVGYGESQPIADNTTTEGRARNRRTEFKVNP